MALRPTDVVIFSIVVTLLLTFLLHSTQPFDNFFVLVAVLIGITHYFGYLEETQEASVSSKPVTEEFENRPEIQDIESDGSKAVEMCDTLSARIVKRRLGTEQLFQNYVTMGSLEQDQEEKKLDDVTKLAKNETKNYMGDVQEAPNPAEQENLENIRRKQEELLAMIDWETSKSLGDQENVEMQSHNENKAHH